MTCLNIKMNMFQQYYRNTLGKRAKQRVQEQNHHSSPGWSCGVRGPEGGVRSRGAPAPGEGARRRGVGRILRRMQLMSRKLVYLMTGHIQRTVRSPRSPGYRQDFLWASPTACCSSGAWGTSGVKRRGIEGAREKEEGEEEEAGRRRRRGRSRRGEGLTCPQRTLGGRRVLAGRLRTAFLVFLATLT